jgi:hypothetical protein
MSERTQSAASHAQWTPGYHFFASPLAVIYLIWAIKRAMTLRDMESHFILVGAFALVGTVAMLRLGTVRVQDRIIRLEERLRLARILPADLQPRIEEIRVSHLIALRFASDGEVTELVRKVLANPDIKPKEIKGMIKQWRSDFFRV